MMICTVEGNKKSRRVFPLKKIKKKGQVSTLERENEKEKNKYIS